MPVLARSLEAVGLSTVLVTPMPFWAEKTGVPRALAVEFPFGSTLGRPGDAVQQLRVIRQALQVLAAADRPGTIAHSPEVWPVPAAQATKDWQPSEPSPVIRMLTPRILEIMRQSRK